MDCSHRWSGAVLSPRNPWTAQRDLESPPSSPVPKGRRQRPKGKARSMGKARSIPRFPHPSGAEGGGKNFPHPHSTGCARAEYRGAPPVATTLRPSGAAMPVSLARWLPPA